MRSLHDPHSRTLIFMSGPEILLAFYCVSLLNRPEHFQDLKEVFQRARCGPPYCHMDNQKLSEKLKKKEREKL